jgi:hypothetical protein
MDNIYIYGRNIWCKYICGKYIFPLEDFLELKHCEARIVQQAQAAKWLYIEDSRPSFIYRNQYHRKESFRVSCLC